MNLTHYEMPIDRYNYSKASDQNKRNYYENHSLTKTEKEKTQSLRKAKRIISQCCIRRWY